LDTACSDEDRDTPNDVDTATDGGVAGFCDAETDNIGVGVGVGRSGVSDGDDEVDKSTVGVGVGVGIGVGDSMQQVSASHIVVPHSIDAKSGLTT
jgi:hypothetical protein